MAAMDGLGRYASVQPSDDDIGKQMGVGEGGMWRHEAGGGGCDGDRRAPGVQVDDGWGRDWAAGDWAKEVAHAALRTA